MSEIPEQLQITPGQLRGGPLTPEISYSFTRLTFTQSDACKNKVSIQTIKRLKVTNNKVNEGKRHNKENDNNIRFARGNDYTNSFR